MKEILINIIIILYGIITFFILSLAILYPFTIDLKNNPVWLKWYLIYPSTLIICASQRQCIELIDKYKN